MAAAAEWQDRVKRLFTVSLSDLNPFRRQESYVAVDIGSNSIKMLEVRTAVDQLELLNWGSIPTPAAAIQSNMVSEPDRVADAVKALLEAKGVRAKKAVTAVPGPAVMIKRVTLPAQSPQETENTIMFEAGNFIPEELDNVNLDYQVIDWIESGNKMEVLVVAVKRDIINSYTAAIRAAGLDPAVVDVDYFALENMFELNYDVDENQVIGLVNIGAAFWGLLAGFVVSWFLERRDFLDLARE